MAHGRDDTMGAGVERSLDHPLLAPRDADERGDAFRRNGVDKLFAVRYDSSSTAADVMLNGW